MRVTGNKKYLSLMAIFSAVLMDENKAAINLGYPISLFNGKKNQAVGMPGLLRHEIAFLLCFGHDLAECPSTGSERRKKQV